MEGGGKWENTGRTLPEKPCGILFTWRGGGGGEAMGSRIGGRIAPDLDKVLLPQRADTSGDKRHSETFPACSQFRNEMSLGQAVPSTRRGPTARRGGAGSDADASPTSGGLFPTIRCRGVRREKLRLRLPQKSLAGLPASSLAEPWSSTHQASSLNVHWLQETLGWFQSRGKSTGLG